MAADIHTQSFVNDDAWAHAQELINVFDPEKLQHLKANALLARTLVLEVWEATRKAIKRGKLPWPLRFSDHHLLNR